MTNIIRKQVGYEENDFQKKLLHQISVHPGTDVVYSPYSKNGADRACFENEVPPEFDMLCREMLNPHADPLHTGSSGTLMLPIDFNTQNLKTILTAGDARENPIVCFDARELLRLLINCQLQVFWHTLLKANRRLYRAKAKEGKDYFKQIISLKNRSLSDTCHAPGIKLLVRGLGPENFQTDVDRKTRRHPFPEPAYGFWGRDMDVLGIEKRLLSRGNLLLVRGMGGVGKTTLLRYAAAWWQTTRLVDQVFYFGCDEKTRTRGEIVNEIAEKLLTPTEFALTFQFLSEQAQQAMVCEKLREERHLVILDNAESITKGNPLTETDQKDIREFLAALDQGQTLVVLGSKDSEKWMARQTFRDNVYELSGLAPRPALGLANRILKEHELIRCRCNPDFRKLIDLLQGHPLAMEVILPDLNVRTPDEIMNALGTDGNIILRGVEHVHSKMSSEAQDFLDCLGPFTSVINGKGMEHYFGQLGQQPALGHLSADLWPKMIQEAVQAGLLMPHPQISALLQIQPALSYFLRTRLKAPGQEERRHAIETAFYQHYDRLGGAAHCLMASEKTMAKSALAQILVRPEYENLNSALNFALRDRASVTNLFNVLADYLDMTRRYDLRLELGDRVLAGVKNYPRESTEGGMGGELVEIISDIANVQLLSGRYAKAEQSYQKALAMWLGNKVYDAAQIRRKSASLYHQLGRVAHEKKEWERARACLLKDLQISREFNDRSGISITLRNLLRLWKSGGDQELPGAIADVMGWTC